MTKTDLHRPIYHFLPEKNWMNDPNGPIYYNGEYHLFYQYNPYGSDWGNIHWGHAKSKDLIHWEYLPIALTPSEERGEKHCFSGCTNVNEGIPTIYYTSIGDGARDHVNGAEQWMATSQDGMLTWQKHEGNPVLAKDIHGDMNITEWRDPYVWRENGKWLMVLGGSHEGTGCVLLYESMNGVDWSFIGKLYEETDHDILECPNFFPVGDQFILIFSPIHNANNKAVKYVIGDWDGKVFQPKQEGLIDHSGIQGYYATNSSVDAQGRRILWAWITETSRGELENEGWSGVQALPRVVSAGIQGELKMEPIPELRRLRKNHLHYYKTPLSAAGFSPNCEGNTVEVMVEFDWDDAAAPFYIHVLRSPNGEEETKVEVDFQNGTVTVNREKSSLSSKVSRDNLQATIQPQVGEKIVLHLFIDHSVIEVFVNYQACISTRIYPTLLDSKGIYFSTAANHETESVTINSIDIWKLQSIW